MSIKIINSMLLLCIILSIEVVAQEMPFVYEVENTGADCPVPYLPTFSELPEIHALPDPFLWSDGRGHIKNFSDWRYRRAEIKAEIENYEIGEKPDRPDSITANYAGGILTVNITVNDNTLTLSSQVVLPAGEGPFPVVIGMGSPTGSIPSYIFSNRNIAQITFNFGQVMAHTQTRGNEPINALYPELTYMGAYSAWSWGVSRLIDGLELVSEDLNIDLKRMAVTGCSFAGKMALFAGAFDERIALTIAQESGGGGYPAWRVSETLGNVETLGRTSNAWFIEDMFQFSNDVPKLPHDHHELMAMVAPRALFVTGNPDYEWLADESGHVASNAAHEVWKALDVPDRFGYSIIDGHLHCLVPGNQITEVEAFVDKFLLGNQSVITDITTSPYNTNLATWINWNTPTLANDSSFFGKTNLVYPANLQKELDTNITFLWNKVNEASEYIIQVSRNPAFKTIAQIDSTTDTSKTIINLQKGKKYYWRVQLKDESGSKGPWSSQWNFTTYISAPTLAPILISATQIPNRTDYITLMWQKVEIADQYFIQLSTKQDFSRIVNSAFTADTVINLNRTSEGTTFYWRVQAKNITGFGPWSEVGEFMILLPPTYLVLEQSASDHIKLSWKDNSKVEDGYVIERKQDPQLSFTIIDSLKESGNEYTDTNVMDGNTYTYRIRAYKDSFLSEYSNAASLSLTGIEQQDGLPTEFSISQNYPNPFNPATKVKIGLPESAFMQINMYDVLGREIKNVLYDELPAGYHEIQIDGSSLPSGVYFYKIQSGDFNQTIKMILMR